MFQSPVRLALTGLLAFLVPHAALPQPAPGKADPTPKQPRADRHGDPLPRGATARLGTLRFRPSGPVAFVAYAPDGKALVSSSGGGAGFQVWEAASGRLLRSLPGHLYPAPSAAFSPDGKKLALASGDLKPRLWDVASGKELRQVPPVIGPSVMLVVPAPDGRTVATLCHDQSLWLGDFTGDKPPRRFLGTAADQGPKWRFPINLLAFSPDGKLLAGGGSDARGVAVRIWDLSRGRELPPPAPEGLRGGIACLAFSHDGKTLAVSNGSALGLIEVATGKQVLRLDVQRAGSFGVAFSPDGRLLAVSNYPGIDLVDPGTGKVLRRLPDAHRSPPGLAFSPDGKVLAVGGSSHTIRLWDVAAGKEVGPAAGHQGAVGAAVYSPDGKTIATSGADHTIRLWDAATGRELRRLSRPKLTPKDESRLGTPLVAFLRGGRALAAAWGDGVVGVWDTATGKDLARGGATPGPASAALAFSPDGETLATLGPDSVVRLRDAVGGRELRRLPGPKEAPQFGGVGNPTALAFTPDGRTVVTGHSGQHLLGGMTGSSFPVAHPNRTVRLWEVSSGRLRGAFSLDPPPPILWHGGLPGRGGGGGGHGVGGRLWLGTNPLSVVACSPDGRTLALGGGDGLRLWDLRTHRELRRVEVALLPGAGVAFSPDGRLLAISGQGDFSLCEVATGEQLCRVEGHRGAVACLAFSPDGKSLVSAGADTTALVWDVKSLLEEGRRQAELSPRRLEALWADLAGADAVKADRASWSLAGIPKVAVAFLAARLRAMPAVEAARIERLVKDLNHARYAVRQQSTRDLEALRDLAGPALRQALEGAPLEVRRRVEALLAKVDGPEPPPERLRELRAVEALERAGTAEAVAVLRRLAGGAPQARLTREARGSLERLARRQAAAP
jgi:WD40 repeat protein